MNSKKTQIVDAARTVLARDGGGQFSMRQVATEAAMSLGNLQYHFNKKTDLVEGVLSSYIQHYQIKVIEFIALEARGYQGLKQFIRLALVEESAEEDERTFIALDFLTLEDGMEAQRRCFYQALLDLFETTLATIVDQPCAAGQSHRAACFLLTYIEGFGRTQPLLALDIDETTELLTVALSHMLSLSNED